MTNVIEVIDGSEIALDRHAVIEASAGTGKTHTIERLVLRLLIEAGVALDELLIVTFTDKAAGEMKERIRAAIERALLKMPEHAARLRPALDSFDNAAIQTIHGFCSRLLSQYAFENGQPFHVIQADGAELATALLREQQRKAWPREYAENLKLMLKLSCFPAADGEGSGWESNVIRLARSFRPRCGERLLPEPWKDPAAELQKYNGIICDAVKRLCALAGEIDRESLESNSFHAQYGKLNIHATKRTSRQKKIILPILHFICRSDAASPLLRLAELLDACAAYKPFKDEGGFAILADLEWNKNKANADACPHLDEVVEVLESLRTQVDIPGLCEQLAAASVHRLKDALETHKREHGLIDFDDMLERVACALSPENPGAVALLAALRARFRYAIVDEFQDTDRVQWSIFEKIFVGQPRQRLMLIGDPKQAIYGFRGADVQAYIAAREALCRDHGAQRYSLSSNWRSHPDLIAALNRVFNKGAWFSGKSRAEITFTDVHPPAPEKRRALLYRDTTGRAALTVYSLPGSLAPVRAAGLSVRFIADEIARLLKKDGASPLHFQLDGRPAELREDHIAVLARRTRDAEAVERALSRRGIACSHYKKTGIWQSDEAAQLSFLFKAIANPGDAQVFKKALLTRFFHVPAEKPGEYRALPLDAMWQYAEVPPAHPTKRLFDEWRALSTARHWPRLFQSVLESTGVLFDDIRESDGERRITNYLHILQSLEVFARAENLDFTGIVEILDERRKNEDIAADANLHRLETEKPKVQIMTIHASKGLQFPVVFLAGQFSKAPPPGVFKFHDEEGRVVYDLSRAPENAAPHASEEDDEFRRLYYVALTRAMYKLYVPSYLPEKAHLAGPQAVIVSGALGASNVVSECREIAAGFEYLGNDLQFDTSRKPKLDPSSKTEPAAAPQTIRVARNLFPKVFIDLRGRRIDISSFSSLHRRGTLLHPVATEYSERPPRRDDDHPIAAAPLALPRGAATGDLLHAVLEKIDFQAAAASARHTDLLEAGAPSSALIDASLSQMPPDIIRSARGGAVEALRLWRGEVARLVWNALRTPLGAAGGALGGLAQSERLSEVEFHYPLGAAGADGYANGVIDLIFRRGTRYYLADWKSNTLDSYAPEALAADMRERSYDLQSKLYAVAFVRWLRCMLGEAFDFGKHVGGVYYLYLRGMNGIDDSAGVHFRAFKDPAEIQAFDDEIQRLVERLS